MSLSEHLYTLVLGAARPLLPVLAHGEGKLARGVRGRQGVVDRMERWAARQRDPTRPLVWFHAPSVGEGLQARAVMEALRVRHPEVQLAYTYFSPSAASFAQTLRADFADYLPFDLPGPMRRALELLRPEVIAFTKTEVWPTLSREARRRGVRLALLSATLPPTSSRLSGVARPFLAPAFARLDRLAAVSEADAERFAALGVAPDRRTMMGDARFDQVWERARRAEDSAPFLRRFRDRQRPVLVAGSTWPADEARLLPAVRKLRDEEHAVQTILVPHEPTSGHLSGTEMLLDTLELSHTRLSALGDMAYIPEVLVVDRVGVLGDLYAAAGVAYVGGGFGSAGLHSVLEPAAFGAPVLFGPRHDNAREAAELIAAGGGFAIADEGELRQQLERMIREPRARHDAGTAARAYVEAGRGAAERGAGVVVELMEVRG